MKLFTNFLVQIIFMILFFSISSSAQELDEKIKDIEGEVSKITITTDDGEYSFEGDDAAKLFKRVKSSYNSYMWHSADKDGKKKIVFLDSNNKEHHIEVFDSDEEDLIIISEDIDKEIDGISKKVKVEVEDGNKKVTVTTKENGEEKTEVYEGDEADKYIQEMKEKHGGKMDILIEKDVDGEVNKKKIIIEKKVDKKTE